MHTNSNNKFVDVENLKSYPKIYSQMIYSWKEGEILSSGHHMFPFIINQNADMGKNSMSTINTSLRLKISDEFITPFEIEKKTILIAELMFKDMKRTIKSTKSVKIHTKIPTSLKKCSKIKISSCFYLISSKILVTSIIDKEVYNLGDFLKLKVFLSDRQSIVSGMKLEIIQAVKANLKEIDEHGKSKNFSTFYENCQSAYLFQDGFDNLTIKIPRNISETFCDENLQIFHFLRITVNFKGNINSPFFIKMPLIIARKNVDYNDINLLDVMRGVVFPITMIDFNT